MASELASEKFQGGAVGHAARKAKRAWTASRAEKVLFKLAQVDWAGLDIKGARDFVHPATGRDEEKIVVLLDTGGSDVVPRMADQLVSQSDGALAGILYCDGRCGAALPSLRTQKSAATLSPVRERSLPEAVVLGVGADKPRVMPLQAAMTALGLQWNPVAGAPAHDSAAAAAQAAARTVLQPSWLVGAEGSHAARDTAAHVTAAHARAGGRRRQRRHNGASCGAIRGEAAGEAAAADAVEAAIEAAHGADGDVEQGEEWQQRLHCKKSSLVNRLFNSGNLLTPRNHPPKQNVIVGG
eukprot:23065-Pleurochrysis_carterae.AAC.1